MDGRGDNQHNLVTPKLQQNFNNCARHTCTITDNRQQTLRITSTTKNHSHHEHAPPTSCSKQLNTVSTTRQAREPDMASSSSSSSCACSMPCRGCRGGRRGCRGCRRRAANRHVALAVMTAATCGDACLLACVIAWSQHSTHDVRMKRTMQASCRGHWQAHLSPRAPVAP